MDQIFSYFSRLTSGARNDSESLEASSSSIDAEENNENDSSNDYPEQNYDLCSDSFLLIDLPDEVILYIFTFLDAKCISNQLQFVTGRLYALCQENRLWKKITQKAWTVRVKPKLSWRSYYLLKSHLQNDGAIEWTSIPPSTGLRPSRRYQNTSTTVGSKIYLIGGQESARNRFNDIFEFDTETYTFTRVEVRGPSQPPSFARHIAVAIGSKIWIHGGFDGHGTYFGVSVFDVEESSWTYLDTTGDKPCARTNHAAAAIGKYIYIYGGIKRNSADNALEDLGDMYVLDTETLVWREEVCTNLPPPRCGHKMLAMRGKLYLFGGGAGEDWATTYNDINVYDPETRVWTLIEATGFADTSTFSCMFAMDPFIFVFGGQCKTKKECSKAVYCYDTLAQAWTLANPVKPKNGHKNPDARDMATMSVCGHSAFLFGGYNQECFDDVYLLRLTKAANRALETLALEPSPLDSSSPVPSSSSSRYFDNKTTELEEDEEEIEKDNDELVDEFERNMRMCEPEEWQ